jgi:hypothetical protein
VIDEFDGGALTIMHADYRLDNMFFGAPGAPYEFAVIDWQSRVSASTFSQTRMVCSVVIE